MTTIAKQHVAAQEQLVTLKDTLVEQTKAFEEDSTNHDVLAVIETISQEIEAQVKTVDTLARAEKALMAKAFNQAPTPTLGAPAIVKSQHLGSAKGSVDLLVKSAVVAFAGHVQNKSSDQVINDLYGNDDQVKAVVGMTKSAQNPAMTNVSGWAQELTRDSYGAFLELLKPESVIPRLPLAMYGFDGHNNIKIPSRVAASSPNLAGAFRAEGAPIRVGAAKVGTQTLTPKSLGIIGTFTEEMLASSIINFEQSVRQWMLEDTAEALDGVFLGSTAGSAVSPAGIQNGVTGANTRVSGGSTAAAITADLRSALQSMANAKMGRRPVWIMSDSNAIGISLALTATGQLAFPTMSQDSLLGYPVVTSINVPAGVVFLIDASELAFAGGAPVFSSTNVATIHEEDTTPLPIVGGGTGTAGATAASDIANPVRSLWQTNSAAVKCTWQLDWSQLRGVNSGAVQIVSAATY